jgi:phosphoribosylformylglycinamidine synthase subunit PurS
MRFQVQLVVSLKEGLLDPQGKAVEAALPTLGWENVRRVSVGKYVRLEVEARTEGEAKEQVSGMAERFLSNPVIEEYRILEAREMVGTAGEDRR